MENSLYLERLDTVINYLLDLKKNTECLNDIKMHLIHVQGLIYYLLIIVLFIVIWTVLNIVIKAFIR